MNLLHLVLKLKKFNPEINWSLPPNLELGILTTNYAFILAKKERINPNLIVQKLAEELETFTTKAGLDLKITTAGAYLNLDFKPDTYQQIISELPDENILSKDHKKVIVDFCSLNVAKPLHAGHIRNIDIGESLIRLLKLKYTEVKTENYWGDWGVQFGIMIWAWKIFLEKKVLSVIVNGQEEKILYSNYEKDPIDTLVKIYIWGNQQKEKVENFDALVRSEFLALEKGDSQNRQIWESFLLATKKEIYPQLESLGVARHDYEFGESFYEGRMKELSQFLEENNIWQKDGQARFFDFETLVENWDLQDQDLKKKISKLGRCYLVSSAGYTSYAFRDIAARIHWAGELDMELMITITGNEQNHHFAQFFAICHYLAGLEVFKAKFSSQIVNRFNYNSLVHISYGFLTLPEGKMSTRKGNFLTAQDLMQNIKVKAKEVLESKGSKFSQETVDTVAIAAMKWFDLNRDSKLDLTLNLEQILNFEGNTGIYQLYTVARLYSILEKNGFDRKQELSTTLNTQIYNSEEKLILKQLTILPMILEDSTMKYKPHLLCTYLFDLATSVNSWYGKYSVTGESDSQRKELLLILVSRLISQFEFGLNLLGINTLKSL